MIHLYTVQCIHYDREHCQAGGREAHSLKAKENLFFTTIVFFFYDFVFFFFFLFLKKLFFFFFFFFFVIHTPVSRLHLDNYFKN